MHVSDESNVSGQHKSTVGWPGLPKEDYTVSFWLANARNSHHLERRTTQDLPTEVDLCIIGSGLSGVMLVYFLMTALADSKDPQEPLRILMLEARQFCHGATGRNGGHCRPDTYLGYPGYKACFGSAEAMRLIDLELETLNLLDDIIEKEKIECDFWKGEGMDVFMSQSIATEARQALEEYERDGGTIKNAWLGDKAEAEKVVYLKAIAFLLVINTEDCWRTGIACQRRRSCLYIFCGIPLSLQTSEWSARRVLEAGPQLPMRNSGHVRHWVGFEMDSSYSSGRRSSKQGCL